MDRMKTKKRQRHEKTNIRNYETRNQKIEKFVPDVNCRKRHR